MLLMAAINLLFLGIDIYLAHSISGTIVPNEWIPIYFGPVGFVIVIIAGLISLKKKAPATIIIIIISILSIGVGLLGWVYHMMRGLALAGPVGEQVSIPLLVWAPPIVAPLTFSLVGVLAIAAVLPEDPVDSGILRLSTKCRIHFPFSKSRFYFFLAGLGILATLLSSVLDHARSGFENYWLLVPAIAGIFASVVAITFGVIRRPSRGDIATYFLSMMALCVVGAIGLFLHIDYDLTAGGEFVQERFIRGAPFLAPLLFADMGGLGLLALLKPDPAPNPEPNPSR